MEIDEFDDELIDEIDEDEDVELFEVEVHKLDIEVLEFSEADSSNDDDLQEHMVLEVEVDGDDETEMLEMVQVGMIALLEDEADTSLLLQQIEF